MPPDPNDIPQITVEEARRQINAGGVTLIDVRARPDFDQENIAGALHLGQENYEEFLATTDKSKPVICYCYFGNSSLMVCAALREEGFHTAYSLSGGFDAWKNSAG